ncbi:MAG: hypothetical protein WAM04_13845 [Candidatus Sulfotelmatobacter sp.]
MAGRLFTNPAIVQKTVVVCLIFVCLMLVPFCAASQKDYQEAHDEVRDFVDGGMVHIRLKVGDVRIVRGDSNKIRMHYTIKSDHEGRLKDTHLNFEVSGRDANIEFHSPYTRNTEVDVELEVPKNTNVDVHDKVGDLTVKEIDGDKELELGVGDIRVEMERSAYHLVRASTGIGDVNGDGYGESSGWLGKTLRYRGDGKYELRAHVSVGDITLEGK